jgi:hypothetical protein
MKTSAGRLGAIALAALLGTTALAGCTSSKATAGAGTGAGSTATSAAGPSPSQPADSGAASGPATQDSAGQGTTTPATTSKPKAKPTTTTVALPASLPTTGQNDVQRLVEPMHAVEASDMTRPLDFQRELDPSTTANALRAWVLNPFAPDLIDYDQTSYGLHGEIKPYMDVAIASPKIVDGVSKQYPDFIGGIMAAAGATADLYTPPTYSGHLSGYGLTIDCAHETLKGRTVCAWMGSTPGGGHVPFVGVLVILSTVPTDKAAVIAADVATGLTSY